jgi:hypothetical protein
MSFCVMHITKSLKNKNKSHIFFLKNKIHDMFYFIFSMHFGFNNRFIESMRI